MDTRTQWKLIQRYVAGSSSPQDRQKLKQWMDQDPANKQLVRDVKRIWELTPEEDFNLNVQEAWERFNHRKDRTKDACASARIERTHFYRARYYFQAAAFVLVVLLAGFFVQYYTKVNKNTEVATQFYRMQDLTTGKGEKAKITFSDGTEVILNAAGSLRFPKEFHGSKREVYLDGEAYFEVAHDPHHPFVVHAGNARVHVLGTKFNVRAWSMDARVDVAVREGKVAVNAAGSGQDSAGVTLIKDQFTSVRQGNNPIPAQDIDADDYLLWIRGGLYFNNAPFRHVVRDIERKFDVQVTVTDKKMMAVPFTGTFRNAELSEILKVIAASMEMEYRRRGSEITFE